MRGALMEATLPVVMRTTCVCPSRLLSAAVKRFVMLYLEVGVSVLWWLHTGEERNAQTFPDRVTFLLFEYLFILIYFPGRSLMTAKLNLNLKFVSANQVSDQF